MQRHLRAITAVAILAPCAGANAQVAQHAATKPLYRGQFIAQMDAEFRKMDVDKNGQLSRAEVEQSDREKAEALSKARNRAQFAELDTNGNGQLSPAEFARLTPPAIVNAGPLLARMDGNRDQQISLVEYRVATVANFDRLDTDRNGVVSTLEMKAAGVAPR